MDCLLFAVRSGGKDRLQPETACLPYMCHALPICTEALDDPTRSFPNHTHTTIHIHISSTLRKPAQTAPAFLPGSASDFLPADIVGKQRLSQHNGDAKEKLKVSHQVLTIPVWWYQRLPNKPQ